MPRLIIQGRDNEVVYDGEGELRVEPGPAGSRFPGRVSIRQEGIRPTERRGREMDITGFMQLASGEYTVQYRVPPPVFHWDPETTVSSVPQDYVDTVVLRVDYPAGGLRWLGDVLRQPFETAEERRARHEEQERQRVAERERTLPSPVVEGYAEALRAEMLRWRPTRDQIAEAFGFDLADLRVPADVPDFPDVLARIQDRQTEHEQVIASARAEFPHDPYDYGRIYPHGPSHWTPPDDPDERIPSCPA